MIRRRGRRTQVISVYAVLNCIMIGATLYVAVQYVLLWKQDWPARLPLLVAMLCLSGALVLASVVGIHSAGTIAAARRFLDLRALAAAAFGTAQVWFFAELSGLKPRWYLWPITAFFATIFMLCLVGFPLNGQVLAVVPQSFMWGDTLWFPVRDPARWWGWPVYSVALSIQGFAIVGGVRSLRRDRVAGVLLVVTGCVGVIIFLSAAFVDVLRLLVPYPAVLSVVLYIVFSLMLVSREHRQRGARLAVSESRQAAVFNASNDGIIMLDETHCIVASNPAALRLAGCDHSQCAPTCTGRTRCGLVSLLTQLTAESDTSNSDVTRCDHAISQCDGSVIPVEATTQILRDGERLAWLVTLRDLRERQRQERERRQMEQLSSLGLLASGIAHDFRNVAAGVRGVSELLCYHAQEPQIQSCVEILKQCSVQATALCENVLRFARHDIGQTEVYDVHDAVFSAATMFLSGNRGTKVNLSGLAAQRHTVLGSRSQFQSAFLNLCFNARDAMAAGGAISVTSNVEQIGIDRAASVEPYLLVPGQYLVVTISDTGRGMQPEVLEKCFEPLFTTKGSQGTGLGLSCVRSAMLEHRGAVEVTSVPEQGTTFTLLLPLEGVANAPV